MKVLNISGPFICDKCGTKHKKRNLFHTHIRSHRIGSMFCDLCPQSFNLKCLILRHMNQKHMRLSTFFCTVCDYKSPYVSVFKKHMLRHGMKTECKICHSLVFNMKDHLKSHLRVKCPHCGKVLSKSSLLYHTRRCHKNTKKHWK